MPWNRNEPDPLDARRRQLAEQERQLAEQRRRLTDLLHPHGELSPGQTKRAEPLVWRTEDEGSAIRTTEPTPARKRNLGRQRRRDRIVVFGLILLFLIVVGLVVWVAYVHNLPAAGGA